MNATLGVSRRSFINGALAAGGALLLGGRLTLGDTPAPGLIIRQKEPENFEMAFPTLADFITPVERFYVRNHFPVPKLDLKTWKLRVEGAVEKPVELTLEELKKLPSRTVTATLECAGNSRVFLTPRASGVLWELGAVGNAEWTGVPLSAVLEKAGLRDAAVEVVLEGADSGEVREPQSPGAIAFARSLPVEKARKPEVLLAFQMNGKDLTPHHGWPLRAIVPGWYGMASVKWLTRLVVVDRPFDGFFQSLDYTVWKRTAGLPTLVPITEMEVKAEIARPSLGEVVKADGSYRVFGAAWAGESEIAKVEISTDGGQTWAEAKLLDRAVPFAWRFWEYTWKTPGKAGRHTLMARATDRRGRVQPMKRDPDRRNYLISHVLPIEVEVK